MTTAAGQINSFINLAFKLIPLIPFRSDAQRAQKQKEAKEREMEHAAFSAERIGDEGGFPMSMVSEQDVQGIGRITIIARVKT